MWRTGCSRGAGAPRLLTFLVACLALACLPGPGPARAAEPEEPIRITADQAEGGKGFTTLTGHVVLRQGTATLTGESGFYDRDNHHQNLTGGVRYTDGPLLIRAAMADNYDRERTVVLTGGVTVSDTSGTMTASRATYYRREGRLVLEGNVSAKDRKRDVTAQQVFYYKDTRDIVADGQVRLEDHDNEAVLTAPRVLYNRDTERLRSPQPSELRLTDQGKVTLITCDTLSWDGKLKVADAVGHVRIGRDSLVAEAERALLYRDEHRAVLVGAPRASDKHGETTGDTLVMHWTGKEIDRVEARANARVLYKSRPSGGKEESSEATGGWLALALEDQKAKSLTVRHGVKNEFRSRTLATAEEDVNTAEGDSMTVYFVDNEARLATVHGARAGRYRYEPGTRKDKSAEDVRYVANRIDYDLDRDRVYLRDEARMEYKDLVLRADSVEYEMQRSVLTARGNPRLKDPSQEIEGGELGYDLKNKQGHVSGARTSYSNGIFTGDDIKKVDDNVLNVKGGDYTTCEDPEPHYRIHSSEMKIYLHDKVVLRPVVFYIKDLPVLALPFYVFPIREGRHSGILFPQFDLGFSSTQGRFFRNAGYYWAMNEYADLAAYGDYYELGPRYTLHMDGRYALRYRLNGSLYSSISKDVGAGTTQWQLQGTHQQQLGERTALSVSADFISDAQYLQDQGLGRAPEQRVSRNMHSLLALSHAWAGGSLNLSLDRNQNLAVDPADTLSALLDEALPSLQVSFAAFPLGRKADAAGKGGKREALSTVYLGYSARLARQVHETRLRRSDRSAFGGSLGLSDNRRLLGWLNVSPQVSMDHALVDEDALGNKLAMGAVWRASFSVGTTLYGAFQPHWGPFEGVRHVLSPRVSYTYQPEFKHLTYVDSTGRTLSRFPSIAGIGLSGVRQSRLNIGVSNTFQLKLKSGGEIKRLDNFANLDLNTGYNFLAKEQTPVGQPVRPWDVVSASLRIYPGGVGGLDFNATYDPYRTTGRTLQALSFSTSFTRSGRASFETTEAADSARAGAGLPQIGVQRGESGTGAPASPRATPGRPAGGAGAWSLSLSFSYGGSSYRAYDGTSVWSQTQRLNSRASYELSPNWHAEYANQYDLTKGLAVYQEFTVRRDLHCWEARFSRRIQPGISEYYLRIGVKNRPEIGYSTGSSGLGGLLGSGSPFGNLFGQ
ncbi:MAG: hypothetical protein HZB25_07830 [Candidatus Eisenbacteria bacterium]|nr:hypothetical protein [Candidatus Eisenbacteria bacterium]